MAKEKKTIQMNFKDVKALQVRIIYSNVIFYFETATYLN